MENIIGHRRLPPQRTGLAMSQAGIAKAVVPEVSLVWEGEESVYWRPNSPCPRPALEPSLALRTSSSKTFLTARPAVLPSRWPSPTTTAATSAVHEGHRYLMQQHPTRFSHGNTSGEIRGANQPMQHQLLASSQSRQEGLRKSPLNHQNKPAAAMSNVNNMQDYTKLTDNSGPQSILTVGKVMESVGGKPEHQTSISCDTDSHPYNSPPKNTNDALARLMQVAEYNPLVYSSGGRNVQTANNDGRRHTPQIRKDPKLIIPRAMDFTEEVSSNANIRAQKREDKENISPVKYNLGHGHSSSTSASDTLLRKGFENQVVPYDQSGCDSPQMQVSSPAEPYLCKMIDRKDQQIFQLHKVLEAVLSKADGNCTTNFPSPLLPLRRAVETQTSHSKSNKPESRTVGVNTDITWSELLESVREGRAVTSEQRSVTILKNSNLRRSASSTVIHKSSNTSSVRFDTCQQMMEEDERIAEVRGVEEVAGAGSCVPQHCRCCQCVAIVLAKSDPKSTLLEVGGSRNCRNTSDERHIDTRDRNHEPSRNGRAQGERAAEATAEPADPTPHYSGSNHREVSLTLRELVLTTIQEDPTSPQHSLHLDLPEYRGDTLHQQLPPNRQPSPPAASCRVAAPRLIRNGNDHWPPEALTTATNSHRLASSDGARGRLGPVETEVLASTTPRHHSPTSANRVYGNRYPNSHGKAYSPSPNARNRCHSSKAQHPQADNGRRDRGETEHQAQQGTGGGVTIYRNLVNNLQQILEPTSNRQAVTAGGPQQHKESRDTTGSTKQSGNNDQHLDVLQQQLRHFGLSFLERKPVQEALGRTDGGLPHSSPSPYDVYRDNPPARSTQPHDNKSPVDFSIATVEFLRQNGLLNAER